MLSHFYQPCILTMQSRFSFHASLSFSPAFEFKGSGQAITSFSFVVVFSVRPSTYAFPLFALLALALAFSHSSILGLLTPFFVSLSHFLSLSYHVMLIHSLTPKHPIAFLSTLFSVPLLIMFLCDIPPFHRLFVRSPSCPHHHRPFLSIIKNHTCKTSSFFILCPLQTTASSFRQTQ
jgi:hypothetical protein